MSTPTTETTTTETPPAVKPIQRATDDKFMAAVLGDMGKIVGENGELTAAPADPNGVHQQIPHEGFTTMADVARSVAEKKTAAEAGSTTEKKEEAKTKTDDVKAVTEAKTETTTTTKTEDKPKIKVEKGVPLETLVEGIIAKQAQKAAEKQTAETAVAAAAQPADKTAEQKDPDADYVETLDRKQKKHIELARFAAKQDPKKFGAMPKRFIDYFKKVDTYIEDKRKSDSEWDPDEDETFASFIEDNRPVFHGVGEEDLREQMIEARVEDRVQAKIQPKLDAQAEAQFIQEIKPELERAAETYRAEVPKRFIVDDKSEIFPVVAKLREKGLSEEAWAEAKALNPTAAKVIRRETDRAAALGRELLELTSGVSKQVPFKSDLPVNSEHNARAIRQQQLYGFIDTQEALFNRDGGDARVRENRTFMPRRQFFSLPPADQAKHWTISAQDVLEMLAIDTGNRAEMAYKMAIKELEDEGYVRKPTTKETKTETQTEKKETQKSATTESPKAIVTSSPGAGSGAAPTGSPILMSEDELKKSWAGGHKSWV